jgi:kynureninase
LESTTLTDNLAARYDAEDPLKGYREKFHIPQQNGRDVIYFAGNSLGLQPKTTKQYIEQELDDWAKLAVDAHFEGKIPWKYYHEYLTEKTARLVGALPHEVVNMNSLTVNLNLMLVSFYRPTKQRNKILIEADAFPSDIYAVESHIKFHGYNPKDSLIKMAPREGEDCLRTEDIEELIEKEGDSISLIMFGGVNYYTGQAFEMDRITRAGHAKGCMVGFDLAHAAGNLELKLHEWGPDFAVWCSYKYLNSGPGGVAGCFIHERHKADYSLPRFSGWWGHNKQTRFLMPDEFEPSEGIEGWQISNPPIFQMAALNASLDIFDEAGISRLREKSKKLTAYAESLFRENNNIRIITPSESEQRGCQLSLRVGGNGKRLHSYLLGNGVVCDWREPDVIRVAPVPLYNTFADVRGFAELLNRFVV